MDLALKMQCNRTVKALLHLLVMTSTAGGHQHDLGTGGVNPEPYVDQALSVHPGLRAIQRRAEAMKARQKPAGAWMDPLFSVGIANLPYQPLSFTATPMTGIRFGLSQRFPWPGKLDLKEAATTEKAQALVETKEERANQLAAQIRLTFYDVHFVDVTIEVIKKNLKIIDGFVEIADAKYRVGRGLQQDALKARVARGQMEEQMIGLRRRRAALEAQMGSLVAQKEAMSLPSLINVAVTEFPLLGAQALIDLADAQRPLLRSLAHQSQAQQKMRKLADKAAYPDFTVALGYTLRLVEEGRDPVDGADFLSLSAGLNLPIWYGQKQGPLREAAAKEVQAIDREIDAARLEIREVILSALFQIPELMQQMEKYRSSIIPTTRQTLDADRIAFQVDKVDFLNLLDIEMRLLNFEVEYHRLHVEREKLIVRLAQAVGVAPKALGRTP